MKTPICSFDAKTGVLCSKCESKLSSGDITHDDIDASIRLTRLAEKNQDINKFTVVRAAQVSGDYVLVVRSPDISVLRHDPSIARKVENEFGGKVWFVEAEASDRVFVENLLYPARVVSVNFFWLPDGAKLTKAVVANKDIQRLDVKKIQQISKTIRNIELLVEFEQTNG
jgi:transcription antitermination factor NusA-like protein